MQIIALGDIELPKRLSVLLIASQRGVHVAMRNDAHQNNREARFQSADDIRHSLRRFGYSSVGI